MTLEEFEQARANKKAASQRVASLLMTARTPALRARALRMHKCQDFYLGDLCPVCHTFHATSGSRCRDRLCPDCGWILAVERSLAVRRALSEVGSNIKVFHVVLTQRDALGADGELLRDEVNRLIDAYSRLCKSKVFKAKVWGTVRNLEVSNKGNARYHPHIHALWVMKVSDPPRGRMFTHDEVCDLWQKALRVNYRPVTWIEPIYSLDDPEDYTMPDDPTEEQTIRQAKLDAAVAEACKYAIKPSLYNNADVDMLEELNEGLKSQHLFTCTGGMAAAYRKAVLERNEEKNLPMEQCGNCGAKTEHVALNWQNGGFTL